MIPCPGVAEGMGYGTKSVGEVRTSSRCRSLPELKVSTTGVQILKFQDLTPIHTIGHAPN